MDEKIKHLEFIQNIINRMAKNSFLLKGWSITLVVATLSFGGSEVLELLPVIVVMFFVLDIYFLYKEKLFRELYNKVRENKIINFDLSIKEDKKKFFRTLYSPSSLIFYIILFLLTIN